MRRRCRCKGAGAQKERVAHSHGSSRRLRDYATRAPWAAGEMGFCPARREPEKRTGMLRAVLFTPKWCGAAARAVRLRNVASAHGRTLTCATSGALACVFVRCVTRVALLRRYGEKVLVLVLVSRFDQRVREKQSQIRNVSDEKKVYRIQTTSLARLVRSTRHSFN